MKLPQCALEGLLGGLDGAMSLNDKVLNTLRGLYPHECSHHICEHSNAVISMNQEEQTKIQERAPTGAGEENPEKEARYHSNSSPHVGVLVDVGLCTAQNPEAQPRESSLLSSRARMSLLTLRRPPSPQVEAIIIVSCRH